MKRLFATLCLTAVSLPSATLTQKERDTLLAQLDKSAQTFLRSLDGVSETQWSFKPAPDRWSIAECAEHVVTAEGMMFTLASSRLIKMPTPENPKHRADEAVINTATDRSTKVKTGAFLEPTGRYKSKAETIDAFRNGLAQIVEYVKTTQDDLRAHGFQSPNGYTDAYQFLLSIAGHTERHSQQIAEVKADTMYPKK